MADFKRKKFQKATGIILKQYRNKNGMTQEEVADLLELSRSNYASIECGRIRVPADVIWRLSIWYVVPARKLLPEQADTPNQTEDHE